MKRWDAKPTGLSHRTQFMGAGDGGWVTEHHQSNLPILSKREWAFILGDAYEKNSVYSNVNSTYNKHVL